ncbi:MULTISPECIES: helix-turn-helix domain-containing protein [Vibrio harveyi group]|uniref:helix-turn-helix domain-containing protein n=1 Tax=Vibrio harveyi group TaxID=717610 RepID=UPI0004DB70AD|nr:MULTISPECIES: helix-turn-helix transcriptional regulator [Vibrio harveyi group]EGQ8132128.1 helix-turn-helix transcriptional regulator [Vibrio parahaemolyticus]EGQ8282141.1 helix-turn-helix domain-containing protein [Vibrio parahaemolyticus]EGQ8719827.1 helix-turn-helix domain-containing protein [Vibrio parahaemolyticus]EGQ8813081.1 helix-turn-helix domain-containing protein [Vibrio parahaemolyticus]EGQ8838063.1 helix-turn-helix domain-containing protein [Vibrio parahaemolyticus]
MKDDKELLKSFGERVKSLRVELGMSQERLAESSGLHRTYIGSLERGQRNVSYLNILKIAAALGISASVLLEGLD